MPSGTAAGASSRSSVSGSYSFRIAYRHEHLRSPGLRPTLEVRRTRALGRRPRGARPAHRAVRVEAEKRAFELPAGGRGVRARARALRPVPVGRRRCGDRDLLALRRSHRRRSRSDRRHPGRPRRLATRRRGLGQPAATLRRRRGSARRDADRRGRRRRDPHRRRRRHPRGARRELPTASRRRSPGPPATPPTRAPRSRESTRRSCS